MVIIFPYSNSNRIKIKYNSAYLCVRLCRLDCKFYNILICYLSRRHRSSMIPLCLLKFLVVVCTVQNLIVFRIAKSVISQL